MQQGRSSEKWGFLKTRGTLLGVIVFGGSMLGFPSFRKLPSLVERVRAFCSLAAAAAT